MLYESLKVLSSRPAAGNTCVSMTKMIILGPKSCQNDKFQAEILNIFGSYKMACMAVLSYILMPWSSGKLPGMILDRFGITHFFIIFLKNLASKVDLERSTNLSRMNRF